MTSQSPPSPDPVWQVEAQLGEGPVWVQRERALYFVDIKGACVHRWYPESLVGKSAHVGGAPSFIVPATRGRLVVGSNLTLCPFEDDVLGAPLVHVPQPEGHRTNDATVDADGRLWFGTMDNAEAGSTGAIWCLADGLLTRAGGEAVVTNGPAVDDRARVLYHVDTLQRRIWRFGLRDEPLLRDGEPFIDLRADEGYPDGIVVDDEGCLWVALWDGWGVRRYAPDGTLLLHVPFPCARVTKLAFGGPGLRTAFVTTARTGLDASALAQQPLAGSLFAFAAPARGRSLPEARIA